MQVVPVKIRQGARHREVPLMGLAPGAQLRRIVEIGGTIVTPAAEGLTLTRKLADLLAITAGDQVDVEEQEGRRRRWRLRVHALADEGMGLQAYLTLPAMQRLLGEEPRWSVLYLRIDPRYKPELLRRLHRSPRLSSVDSVQTIVAGVRDQSGRYMSVITAVVTLLAACIAVGVVYNNARISLSQRSRDLASLRVLGFTRGEVSAVLIGEMALHTALGLPLGLLLGHWWAGAVASSTDVETVRFPVIVSDATHLLALGVALLAAAGSALWVRRRLDDLDLIAVLKTRE
jgi:putative ABC transport system permease protein